MSQQKELRCRLRCPSGPGNISLPTTVQTDSGNHQVPAQRVPEAHSWVQGGWDVKLTTDIYLESRAKMCDATPHCIHMPWHLAQGQIYIYVAKFRKHLLPSSSGKKRLLS